MPPAPRAAMAACALLVPSHSKVWGSNGIEAAIGGRGGVVIDVARDAATVQVHSDGQSIGFLHAKTELTVD